MRADPWRETAVIGVVALLETGEPTRLAFESAARHGLRQGLCLTGWPWQAAEDAASALVAKALHQMGVARPRWADGQPESVEPVGGEYFNCVECGKALPPYKGGPPRKFCDVICRRAQQERKRRQSGEAVSRIEYLARMAAERDMKRPIRPCAECGKEFRPRYDNPNGRFCGNICAGRAIGRRKKRA